MSLVDVHNHVVPGVDDGARDEVEAVAALERLVAEGATAVLTTPHFRGSLTLAPAIQAQRLAELDRGWERLLAAPGLPPVELFRGAEILLDLPEPQPDDERVRIAGGPFVLVEFPYMAVPPSATRPLEWLRSAGWVPVLAHPERYDGAGTSKEAVVASARRWRDAGAYLQVNGPSLLGRYGDGPRRRAAALLEAGLVDYFGSDYHSRGEPMIDDYRTAMLQGGHQDAWTLLTQTNPSRMIQGQPPLPVPAVTLSRSWLDRLRRK
jgi:protein-tyrosine phosphatase